MNKNIKPLGLAAAVAAASVGMTGVAHAQVAGGLSGNGLGDMAIIPYYTVQGDFVTGFHIINTSDATQVVKLRFRRARDSMDALDFNIIMSPKDEWTGFIDDSSGSIVVGTDDKSCTAPLEPYYSAGQYPMPPLYSDGAEEGYIEVIGMAQAAPYVPGVPSPISPVDAQNPININATHTATGLPLNCGAVESNFFRNATGPGATVGGMGPAPTNGDLTKNGVINSYYTHAIGGLTGLIPNNFVDTPNVLKVSYFVRDGGTGLEFGGDAIHFADWNTVPMMTNQEEIDAGAATPDAFSFLFPDLDGGSPVDTVRGLYDGVVRAAIGGRSVINDWSVASARNVSTDWVVTMPGQYLMLDLNKYTRGATTGANCFTQKQIDAQIPAPIPANVVCDARDIPVVLDSSNGVWDREEQTFQSPEGGLVISPQVGIGPSDTTLDNEVNVIEWTAGENPPVLDSAYTRQFDVAALGADNGWANLSVSSDPRKAGNTGGGGAVDATSGLGVYDFTSPTPLFTPLTNTPVPVLGFVVWERSFPSDPSANYGRLVDHSYGS